MLRANARISSLWCRESPIRCPHDLRPSAPCLFAGRCENSFVTTE